MEMIDQVDAVSHHVNATLEYLDRDVKLRQLLALTYPYVEAGQAAFELVWPLLRVDAAPSWSEFHLPGPAPIALSRLAACSNLLERVDAWEVAEIERAILRGASILHIAADEVAHMLVCMIFRRPTVIPLPKLLHFLGQKRSLQLLRRNTELFRELNLVS